MKFFQKPTTKIAGWIVLAGLIGMAVGNHFKTEDALVGQAMYYQGQIHKKVDQQRRLDEYQFFGN